MKMPHTKKSLALLTLLPGVFAAMAQEQQPAVPEQPTAATAAAESELQQDPQILAGKLENGLSYLIRHTQEPAGRGSLRLVVKVGSQNENETNSGISHFLEHMVFNGSRTFKRGELIPTMQKLGLGFGGDANAYTSLLHTVYMLDLPNLDEKTVDFAMTIMRDFADGATLEDDAIDHERGIVVSELKSRDSANYRAMIALMEQLTEGTRMAQYMPIGREDVIRHAPYEIVRNYYRDQYVPQRMTLILTGDFDPATAEQWVRKHFSTMEAREPAPMPQMGELKQPLASERLIPNPEAGDCTVMASVVRPWQQKADTLSQRVEDMPLQLALAMLNRRLSLLARREDCPFTGAKMEDSELFHASEYTGFSVSSKPANWQSALDLVVQQVRQAAQYGFDEAELKEVSTGMISALKQACDTWETVTSKSMATSLVDGVCNELALTAPQEDLRAARAGLERIIANPDLCRKALEQAFIQPGHASLTLMGDLPRDVTAHDLRAAYDRAMQADVPKPTARETKPFAYETIGMPGTVAEQSRIEELGTTLITLSNGVRLNLKPIDFRKGSIHVTAAVDGGSMALPSVPGFARMTGAVMRRGGLQEHSMDELDRLFAGNQVTLNFGMSPTRFIFKGSTNRRDLELQCKLLAAAILYPGYRNEGEVLLRRGLDNRYKELTTTPQGAMSMQMSRAIYGDDPRFTIPTREEMEARHTAEVKEALTPLLRNNAVEVSIVGDFSVEEILPILERTFGAMPQRSSDFNTLSSEQRQVSLSPWGQRTFLRYPTELDKTLVAQARPAGNGRDLHRNRRLAVLASITREKLFDGLRAVMGESYSPSVQVVTNSEYDNAAYILSISAGVKGNRTKVSAAMESICNGLGQAPLSQEDFDCAIRPYITAAEKALITPDFWEDGLLDLQSNPERIGLMKDFLSDVRSITREEIEALAHEVFGKDNTSFFFVVPEDYDAEKDDTAAAAEAPDRQEEQTSSIAPGEYVVISSHRTAADPEWRRVVDTLQQKYPDANAVLLAELTEETLANALREHSARYAAIVLRPEEIGRELVNALHRASRQVDSDPYGDCIWGIVTGYRAEDAMRIAQAKKPLIIKRLLSTTNVYHARFEHSYCITDWEGSPVLEQSGYNEPRITTYTGATPEGKDIQENGFQTKFAEQLSTQRPQLLVTSSHATPFNLEMPFSKGLLFSCNNRFHLIGCKSMHAFISALQPAMSGNVGALHSLVEGMHFPVIQPDTTDRVWLAAGNCLLGDARQTDQSMVITAMSAYRCNQFVGYTVPSWYGESGWGTLHLFMGNTDGTTLAQAFFLNNQFLLEKTMRLDNKLMSVNFDEPEIGPALQRDMKTAGLRITQEQLKDAVGLVHDRDTFAFFGDPAWEAVVDYSHAHAPLKLSWQSNTCCTLTANSDYSGRAAIWFPRAEIGREATGCDMPGAVFTNNFILIPELTLKAGESRTIRLTPRGEQQGN